MGKKKSSEPCVGCHSSGMSKAYQERLNEYNKYYNNYVKQYGMPPPTQQQVQQQYVNMTNPGRM